MDIVEGIFSNFPIILLYISNVFNTIMEKLQKTYNFHLFTHVGLLEY